MGINGIGCFLNPVKGEIDFDRLTGFADGTIDSAYTGFRAEFLDQIGRAVDAVRGEFGIKKKRPPMGRDFYIRTKGQGLIQPAFSDVTPGADGVVNDFDVHGRISVQSQRKV